MSELFIKSYQRIDKTIINYKDCYLSDNILAYQIGFKNKESKREQSFKIIISYLIDMYENQKQINFDMDNNFLQIFYCDEIFFKNKKFDTVKINLTDTIKIKLLSHSIYSSENVNSSMIIDNLCCLIKKDNQKLENYFLKNNVILNQEYYSKKKELIEKIDNLKNLIKKPKNINDFEKYLKNFDIEYEKYKINEEIEKSIFSSNNNLTKKIIKL